jgi:predicted Zn-dependent protease with MMP-like domain
MVLRLRRDRHARGLHGPLLPHSAPIYENAAFLFERLLTDAVDDLHIRLGDRLQNIEIKLEEIPNLRDLTLSENLVPLGRFELGNPNQVIIYRKPIEIRVTGAPELDRKIRDVLAELIGSLIGLRPIDVDPYYAGNNY